MITGKLVTETTVSPVDLQPPSVNSPSIQSTMSPKPSTIQRIQSFFRNTPRKFCFIFLISIINKKKIFNSIKPYY